MRTHIRKKQISKLFCTIAGELARPHEFAGEFPGQYRRMRDLDRYLFLGMGVTTRDEKSRGKGKNPSHGFDLLSNRSADQAPEPAIIMATVIASAST